MRTETGPVRTLEKESVPVFRRVTREVRVGRVGVGGRNPVRVQSMTTTDTLDVEATLRQSLRLAEAGCEIVRITAPTVSDARALGSVKEGLLKRGVDIPLVADIHFSPQAALEAAEYVEKVRINPGNFVDSKRFAVREYTDGEYAEELERLSAAFTPLIEKLGRLKRALRIGVNHGSLSDRILNRYGDTPLGMAESALEYVRIAERLGFQDIILSMKSSNPKVMIQAYRLLVRRMETCGMDYPLHLGVTEAGGGADGRMKSAVGIGTLLSEGLGDTIRVSLTEEPECEIPVAMALARRFAKPMTTPSSNGHQVALTLASPQPIPSPPGPEADPFSFARRKSSVMKVGPFLLGGSQPVRVFCSFPSGTSGSRILALLEARLKTAKDAAPEVLSFELATSEDVGALQLVRRELSKETSRLAFLGRWKGDLSLVLHGTHFEEGRPLVDLASWDGTLRAPASDRRIFLETLRTARIPLLIESDEAPALLRMDRAAREAGVEVLLALSGHPQGTLIGEYRRLAQGLRESDSSSPLHLISPRSADPLEETLFGSTLFGSLLCDGLGDSVELAGAGDPGGDLDALYGILQAAGTRITKAEFVSCPSCGRTLFDLQTTTERIRARTGHLTGVKIAVMGCVVNGPGEMADADFGYVGGAPDRINLYVGRECVRKGVPTDEAVDALVDLIKSNGKWSDSPN